MFGAIYRENKQCCEYCNITFSAFQDALSLQSMAKMEFRTLVQDEQDDGKVPDVMAAFQDILTGIFVSLYTHSVRHQKAHSCPHKIFNGNIKLLHVVIFYMIIIFQDAEERCYSDSLAELPEHDMISDGAGGVKKARALNLVIMETLAIICHPS